MIMFMFHVLVHVLVSCACSCACFSLVVCLFHVLAQNSHLHGHQIPAQPELGTVHPTMGM